MANEQKFTRGAVLITGASSGIGMACALHLDRLGFRIFGGVRKEKDAESLIQKSAGRITPLLLDVTNETSFAAAVDSIDNATAHKGLFGLVNNAGIVVSGPLEFLPLSKIRTQFEVNLFGQIALAQAVLPLLRASRGRIVNMGAIAGRVALPFSGAYSASKFALEAITDALRVELLPWGVTVSIIEPSQVATPIWEKAITATEQVAQNLPSQAAELYGSSLAAVAAAAEKIAATGMTPDTVASAVAHALTSKNPKTRYLVGLNSRLLVVLKEVLPSRLFDRLLMHYFGLTGRSVV